MEIIELTEGLLDEAAQLLAKTHDALHHSKPSFPSVFADARVARDALQKAHLVGGPAAVAVTGGKLVGYMLAARADGMVRLPDHAAEASRCRDIYRRMYEVIAQRLVDSGRLRHSIAVAVSITESVRTWFELGFGVDQIEGIRSLDPLRMSGLHATVRRRLQILLRQSVPWRRSSGTSGKRFGWRPSATRSSR